MINYVKIQSEILKKLIKEDRNKCNYDVVGNVVWLICDNISVRAVPKDLCFLDLDKLNHWDFKRKILDGEGFAVPATMTDEIKVCKDKSTIRKFNVDGEIKWLNEKFVKECDTWKCHKSVFFGYIKGILCMVAMGVNVKNDKD